MPLGLDTIGRHMNIADLPTPALLLDAARMRRNASRMGRRARELGARLRPHVKTHKCVEVARAQTAGHFGGITVSTLAEARAFAEAGFRDITYAVPIEPGKFAPAAELARRIESFAVVTDAMTVPSLLDEAARRAGVTFDVFLEVDCGDHRCGVDPAAPESIEIALEITGSRRLRFAGILTHAGHSYRCHTREEVLEVARAERDVMTAMTERLHASGIDVPVVSIGSTPTITAVDHLDGIDEVRPGNYIFFDEFQTAIGSCAPEECAVSVLAAVVHRDRSRGTVVLDAGALALSKDTGARHVDPSCGFGRVVALDGTCLGLRVASLSQEHAVIAVGESGLLERLQVGERLRVVTNHSCLTVAQFDHFDVVEGDRVVDRWTIHRGW